MELNLNDPATYRATAARIQALAPDSPRRWGKMNVAGMMEHCAEVLDVTNGAPVDLNAGQRVLAFLFRPVLKRMVLKDGPYRKNLPTHPDYVPPPDADFQAARDRLLASLETFDASDKAAPFRHPMFGRFTGAERGRLAWKHLDHHLQQFGV